MYWITKQKIKAQCNLPGFHSSFNRGGKNAVSSVNVWTIWQCVYGMCVFKWDLELLIIYLTAETSSSGLYVQNPV